MYTILRMDPNKNINITPAIDPASIRLLKNSTRAQRITVGVITGAFAAIFLLSGFWIFLPVLVPVIIWYYISYKHQQSDIEAFAKKHGFGLEKKVVLNDLDGVIFQDPAKILFQKGGPSTGYLMNWLVRGKVGTLDFRMYEYALTADDSGSEVNFQFKGVDKQSRFTVMDIAVPGEGLEFLLISKKHPTTLNSIPVNLRKYTLEGDFSDHFILYAPENAEIETLRIFTPDVMADLIDNYGDHNIELTPQHLFIYEATAGLKETGSDLEKLLASAKSLSEKFFIRIDRVDFSKENIVAPELIAKANQSRIAKKFTFPAALITTFIATTAAGFIIYLGVQDNKVPIGYVPAADAKVLSSNRIPCPPSESDCSPNYMVTASFKDDKGDAYLFRDQLIRSYPVNSNIGIYYDPLDPTMSKLPGGHSATNLWPIVTGFYALFLGIVWVAFFASNKKSR